MCQAEHEEDTLMAPPAGTRLFFQKCNAQPYFGNKGQNLWGSEKKLRGPPALKVRGHVQEKQVTVVKKKSNRDI